MIKVIYGLSFPFYLIKNKELLGVKFIRKYWNFCIEKLMLKRMIKVKIVINKIIVIAKMIN